MADLDAVELCRIVDEQCDLFEAAWRGHGEPPIGEYLANVPDQLWGEFFGRLLAIEIELIARSGEWPDLVVYLEEFPQYAGHIKAAFAELQQWAATTNAVGDEIKSAVIPIERDTAHHSLDETVVWSDGSAHESASEPAPIAGLPTQIGRYRIVRELGKGGMGTVVLARDTVLDRDLALKLPRFDPEDGNEPIERFYREARAMATVHHPHLCQVYDAGEADGYHFLTMAYIDGLTLDEQITNQPLSPAEAVRLVRTLALAIHAAHEAGVVHRDLKPSNVMISRDGEPFITDFGLALRDAVSESDITHSGTIVGSPAYMAPEQVEADHDRIGPRTDVYALGVMFYELLTGRRPFEGKGLAVLGQISSGVAPTPPSQIADVSPSVESICLKAMAHRINDRFQSAADLAAALDECLQPVSAQPRKTRRLVTATVAGLLGVIALAVAWSPSKNGTGISDTKQALLNTALPVARMEGEQAMATSDVELSDAASFAVNWHSLRNPGIPLNSQSVEGSPTFSSDGLTVFFHRPIDEVGYYQLYSASRSSLTSVFDPPARMPETVNRGAINSNPRLSSDGLILTFDSETPGDSDRATLWYSRRESTGAAWSPARSFGSVINSSARDTCPFLSDDGLTLAFTSDREGGFGLDDLWIATRESPDEDFGEPANAGPHVNSAVQDSHPWLSSDGLMLMFSSLRPGGHGGFDLWFSSRSSLDDEFGPPVNAGPQINTDGHEGHGSLSQDKTTLYFESSRPNGVGNYDIWIARRFLSDGTMPKSETRPFESFQMLTDSGQQLGNSSAHAVAAGDIDNDGDVDMLVANYPDAQPDQVWLNDGLGNFSQGQQLESQGSSDIELGDIDNDGDLDAITVCLNAPGIIWRNMGSGLFEKSGETEALNTQSLALGDFDGDLDLDAMIGGREDTPPNRVLFNDGTGRLADSGQRLGNSSTHGIAVADLDGDGDLDGFSANWFGGSEIWLNDGKGTFTSTGQRLGDSQYLQVALGDVDHDGDFDACVTSPAEPTRLWINDGHAGFSPLELALVTTPAFGVAIGDFNGDGRNDILIGNGAPEGEHLVFPNLLFVSRSELSWDCHWYGSERTADFAIADLDSDGDMDAYVANGFNHPDRVWLNRAAEDVKRAGDVYFRDSGQSLGRANSNELALGDLDGDGDLDAVVANIGDEPSSTWLNDGTGHFTIGMHLPDPVKCFDVGLGDLDNDGDLDAFLTMKGGPDRIWFNDSLGHFTLSDQKLGTFLSNLVALADFDGDGDLDAWVGCFNPHHDRVWINDGTGRFEDSGQLLGMERNHSVDTCDVDGDGDIDVLTGTGADYPNSLWLNDGHAKFTRSDELLSGTLASNGFTCGDLNGDGFPDLYETGWTGPDRVWLNDGHGRFRQTGQSGHWLRSSRARLADFDGDGDLDVYVGNLAFRPNAICLNDGQGMFSLPVQFLGNSSTNGVALGDLDGDGDIDAFTANSPGQPNRVWLNESGAQHHASRLVPDYSPGTAADIFTSNDYEWTEPVLLDLGGADQAFIAPFISTDRRDLYMVHVAPDRSLDIVVSTRETQEDAWRFPIPLSGPINASPKNGSPTVSSDGRLIIFGSNRPGGHGSYDLWMAERESKDDAFSEPVNLGPDINSSGDDGAARLSADGLSFIFHSTRPDGYGGYDLWKCTRTAINEPFGPPENLGPEVNTEQDERDPAASEDGTVLIYRYANQNLQLQTRRSISDAYGTPIPLPHIVDDERAETPCISGDKLYFVSYRGGDGKRHIWMMRRIRKADLKSK